MYDNKLKCGIIERGNNKRGRGEYLKKLYVHNVK